MYCNSLKKRMIGLCVAVFSMALVACGGKNQDVSTNQGETVSEYSYTSKSIGTLEGDNAGADVLYQNGMGYITHYDWNEETMKSSLSLEAFQIEGEQISFAGERIEVQGCGRDMDRLVVAPSGELYAIEVDRPEYTEDITDYEAYSRQFKYYICHYSSVGELVYEADITAMMQEDENNSYVNALLVDDNGNVALVCQEIIRFLDSQGKVVGKLDLPGWSNSYCYGKSGMPYISYYEMNSGKSPIAQVDMVNKKLNPIETNFGNIRCIGTGAEGELLVMDETKLSEVNVETGEVKQLTTLLDCDIVADNVRMLTGLEDGRILLYNMDWDTNQSEFMVLNKVKTSELVQKEVLTIATLYQDSRLNEYAIDFNKSNDTYKIQIKNYIDSEAEWTDTTFEDAVTNLQNDLVSGTNKVDLISVGDGIPVDVLASKGMIEDLYPYLEKSSMLSKDDYFEKVLEASTFQGVLTSIPRGFYLETLVGKTEVVGEKNGWSLSEMADLCKRYPDAKLFNYGTKQSVLNSLMMMSGSQFYDSAKGVCDFEGEEFKALLSLCAAYPDEYEYFEGDKGMAAKLRDNEVLLNEAYLNDWQGIQNAEAYFDGAPVTYIGYPSVDGSSGVIMIPNSGYAIVSKSEHKDGAWEFLEFLATHPYDSWRDYYFPSKKEAFAQRREEAIKVEYVLDENGEPLLDENGEKILAGGGGGWSDGDGFTYVYHVPTKEEVEKVESLIAISVPNTYTVDRTVLQIILEEAEPYFKSQKSVDEVCSVLQRRVNMYLKENM